MEKTHFDSQNNNIEGEIDLFKIFNILLEGKWIILSVTACVSIFGVYYSLLLPNVYESKALLVTVESSRGVTGSLQKYSSLASIAGVSLPSSASENNSTKAIKKIKSLSFFEDNIMPKIFLPDLMAFESWDHTTNKVIYKENIYNNDSWVRSYNYPNKQIPSAQESFRTFQEKHINISQDKITGFITLTVKHQSPFLAKEWAELIITEVNNFYREKDKSGSQKAINFLNEQIAMTNLSEIKQVIAELMQQETQKLTLIEVSQAYVFDYIDPPAVMEKKSEPSRSLICIIFSILGGLLSIAIVLIRHYIFSKHDSYIDM